jgi:hypothetical protein
MGRLAFALWLFLTPIWILFSFYSFAHVDNVGYNPSSVISTAENMAFIPPELALVGLAIWFIVYLVKRLIPAIRFHAIQAAAVGVIVFGAFVIYLATKGLV